MSATGEGSDIDRRCFLRLASGAVAAVMIPLDLGMESPSQDESGWWIAEVIEVGGGVAGTVMIDAVSRKTVMEVALDGFPEGWELAPGDLVTLDAGSRLVSPYVSSSVEGDDLVYYAQRADKVAGREIARVPLLEEAVR